MALELTVEERDDHIEVVWRGTVRNVLPFASPYDAMPDGSRVLVDARAIEGASNPVWHWAGVAANAADRRLKIAVVSPPGLIFGLFRQALYASGVDQEHAIALFRGRAEALAWLMSVDEPASNFRQG